MPDDKTWTWDQLAQVAAQVTEKLGSQGVYGLDGFGTGAAELGAWARQKGEEVWPTDGPGVSEATITSFFDYANKLVATKATPPASLQVENATAALDALVVRHQQGGFPPAVPHPDLGLRRGERHGDEAASASGAGDG